MFNALPEYPEYQSAGGWIPSMPSTWCWEPARTLFAERRITGCNDESLLSVTIGRGVIPQSSLLSTTAKKDSSNLDKSKYKLVEPGDLVYNKMRAWQGASGGSRYRGIVSPAYVVMRPRTVLTDYIHYLLRTPMFASEAERWSYGITSDQWSLRPEHFKMIRFPVPPSDEQAAIVKYLTHANARIDKAIVAKRRLNSLLREQSDVRHDAIVLGIEPTSDRLASANAWFGDVPSGWSVEPLRARYHQQLGKMLSGKVSSGDHMRPYLRNADVQWNSINVDDLPEMNIPPSEEDRYTARQGDVLVCEGGDVGRAAIWERETPIAFQKALHRLRVISPERDDPRFLVAALRVSKRSGAFSSGRVSTIQHLTGDQIRRHRFAWPPIEEQLAIAEAIADLQAASDATAAKIEREITLLQEFRTRLVADVVTGQVDVRAIAASLPDTPEQGTGLDSILDDDLEDVLSEGKE